MKRVTVFGGSNPRPGEPAYVEALHLGGLLGSSGWAVLTGGYIGTMEAVSRGAAEAGGHVIGVTCLEIENFRPGKANPWVREEQRYETLRERIYSLMTDCDAALALPGGVGTLAEVAVMWDHLLVGAITPRPLVLIGPGWQQVIEHLYQLMPGYIPRDQRRWLTFVPNADSAVAHLRAAWQSS